MKGMYSLHSLLLGVGNTIPPHSRSVALQVRIQFNSLHSLVRSDQSLSLDRRSIAEIRSLCCICYAAFALLLLRLRRTHEGGALRSGER